MTHKILIAVASAALGFACLVLLSIIAAGPDSGWFLWLAVFTLFASAFVMFKQTADFAFDIMVQWEEQVIANYRRDHSID